MASVKSGVTAQAVIHHYHRSETGITIINVKSKQKTIELMAEGSTGQTEMNRQRLQSEIIVTFPESKDLQKRIAEYGLAIDKKITVNNQLNDYLLAA